MEEQERSLRAIFSDKIIMKQHKVTVLLPVYNASRYLKASIDSILNQTYSDFELMIINDGSTDNSEEVILSIKDERINYLKNDKNRGLIYTLNRGLQLISSEYIVRMDADDLALPERIAKQVAFMDRHPEVAVCGTQLKYFGNSSVVTNFPLEHELLSTRLLFAPGINHPTAIMRTKVFRENKLEYDPAFPHIEDYHLWIRTAKYGRLANLPEVLLHYRWEGQNVTYQNWSTLKERYSAVYKVVFEPIGIEPTEENLLRHLELSSKTEKIRDVRLLIGHTRHLLQKNRETGVYSEKALRKALDEFWKKLFFKIAENGAAQAFAYWRYRKSMSLPQLRYFLAVNLRKPKPVN
jgi:glycosyltransferase involved in cell wall biosynthesis